MVGCINWRKKVKKKKHLSWYKLKKKRVYLKWDGGSRKYYSSCAHVRLWIEDGDITTIKVAPKVQCNTHKQKKLDNEKNRTFLIQVRKNISIFHIYRRNKLDFQNDKNTIQQAWNTQKLMYSIFCFTLIGSQEKQPFKKKKLAKSNSWD